MPWAAWLITAAMNAARFCGHVGGEGRREPVPVQEEEPIDRRQDRRHRRARRRVGDQRADRLPGVGRERRDVDERGGIGVVAGLGDDRAA